MLQILIIDDDPLIQMVLRKTLQEQGYEVIGARSGEEGVKQAEQICPALIICDWQMSGMNGLEVCRRIKANPALATTFFVLLTARTTVADRIEGLDAGADEFLPKPIEVSELKARVRAGLRLYQFAQELKTLAADLQMQKQYLEAELAEAADYVRSLLPAPLTGTVTIESQFLPSRQLGGDCFDYYWLDPDSLVIYLLDVSGHGLKAALPSVSIQNLLRSQSLPGTNLYQPNTVLKALNEVFQMGGHNEQYFTIWYGVYNRQKRQLLYASAGHPPAVLVSGNPGNLQVHRLKTPTMPIGMFPDTSFVCDRFDLTDTSTLYVFSDGVYDIQQNGDDRTLWNVDDFIQLLSVCHVQPDCSLEYILQQVRRLSESETFEDDCSLLQVRFGE